MAPYCPGAPLDESGAEHASALRVEPAEIMFIDDKPENVAASEKTGMRSHLFTSIGELRSALYGRPSGGPG